jgi:hypothetical protein
MQETGGQGSMWRTQQLPGRMALAQAIKRNVVEVHPQKIHIYPFNLLHTNDPCMPT